MNDDYNYPAEGFPENKYVPPPSLVPRWTPWVVVLVLIAVGAEFGYRYYEQNSSTEVRPRGIELQGVPVEGQTFSLPIAPADAFHSLRIIFSGDSGTTDDAAAARIGITGLLIAREETGKHRRWSIPVRLTSNEKGIGRRSSVEDVLMSTSADAEGLIGLGTRYRIDYTFTSFDAEGEGYTTLEALERVQFPAGTRLFLDFNMEYPLPRGTSVYLSYGRAPRLLHERLLR